MIIGLKDRNKYACVKNSCVNSLLHPVLWAYRSMSSEWIMQCCISRTGKKPFEIQGTLKIHIHLENDVLGKKKSSFQISKF